MPRSIRFHLDEHCDPAIAAGLRLRGIEVTTSKDVGLLRAPDEDQLDYALRDGRVLFTQDADFLRHHAVGTSHTGLVYCHQQSRRLGEIIRSLELIWEVYEPGEMHNRIEYV